MIHKLKKNSNLTEERENRPSRVEHQTADGKHKKGRVNHDHVTISAVRVCHKRNHAISLLSIRRQTTL